MYDERTRSTAVTLLATRSLSATSRITGISRSTLRTWRDDGDPLRSTEAPAYAALLGYYLGDGCISRHRRHFSLRVSCDAAYPGITSDVADLIRSVRPGRKVFRVRAPGVEVVQSNWTHRPCLFPQHGPGRKHERPIVLEGWQRSIVAAHPADFLRGLFHSDGSRVRNWASRIVDAEQRRYDYPRWQCTNTSDDIRELCCWALDLAEIPWRQSNRHVISVSTREAVARLDELSGLKS